MTIFDSIITIEDQNDMVTQLEHLQSVMFEKKTIEEALKNGVSEDILNELKSYASDKKKNLDNRDDLEDILNGVITDIKQIPVVDIQVAVMPHISFTEKISSMIQDAAGQRVVLHFKKDPRIVGGAGIGFKGFYTEMSLRRKLEEYWVKMKS